MPPCCGNSTSNSPKSEAAFKILKSELGLRPIYHQLENRVEAHILVAFLAYALSVTLKQRMQALAPGLTPRAVLEKLATIQIAGCLSAHHRRPLADHATLYPAGTRASADAPPAQSVLAFTTVTSHQGPGGPGTDGATDTENVVPTFENPSLKTNHLPLSCPLNCESSVSSRAGEERADGGGVLPGARVVRAALFRLEKTVARGGCGGPRCLRMPRGEFKGSIGPDVKPGKMGSSDAYGESEVSIRADPVRGGFIEESLNEFQEHYHAERNHYGRGNNLLFPRPHSTGISPSLDGSLPESIRWAAQAL